MKKEGTYLVRKVDHNGATHAHFTLDLDGVMLLLRTDECMASAIAELN